MSRLIAFGCSYTYGHGLPDCHIEPNLPGPEYSKLAWPNILGNMLDLEVVNCGNPGASNIHILWKLLNFEFTDDDLCVIMWTHFGRHPFSKLKYDSSNIEWDHYESKAVSRLFGLDKEDVIIRNVMNIHHAYLHLLNKNIKHLFIIGPADTKFKFPDIEIPTLMKDITIKKYEVDKSLDNMHPGPNTHMNIAKQLLDKINVIR